MFYPKRFVFHYFIVILVDLKHVPDCSQVGIMMNSENANSLFCDVYAAVVVTPLYPRETYLASTFVVVVFFCHPASFVYYKYPNQDFTRQNLCNRSSTFLRAKQQTRRKNNQQSTGHQWDFRLAISRDI